MSIDLASRLGVVALPSVYAAMLTVVCVAACGCGDGLPERVPVSGAVLIDGQPLRYGVVKFIPESGRASMGGLDQDGRFSLSCYRFNDGATLGRHRVAVVGTEQLPTKTKWHAPKKYAEYKSSGLTEQIEGPRDDIVIEISWDGGQPFIDN